jgi:nitroreductase/dihydropteridine reductase
MSDLIEKLNWRYAAKRMHGETIPEEKLNTILEAIKLAPSSVGLQPYTILVISDKALKERIFEEAAQQPQIKESSHLLVFAAWDKITAEHITEYMNLIAKTRGIEVASLAQFQQKISDSILGRTEQTNFDWAARQAYIALGHASVAAATEHIDSTPMEGFNNAKLDELLELNKKGLKSVVMMTLGYRDSASDHLASAKKVRKPDEELFLTM